MLGQTISGEVPGNLGRCSIANGGRERHEEGMAKGAKSEMGTTRGKALRSVASPKQSRSEATLHRLLDAADRLICAEGLQALSIATLVREAKSSVGGFYGRFKDKDELVRALHERQLGEIRDLLASVVVPERWETVPLKSMIEALVAVYQTRTQGRRRLIAAFLEASARNPEAWEQGIAFRKELIESIAALLLLRKDEIAHPEPEKAVRFALQQAFAFDDVRSLYAHVPGANDFADEAEFATELARSMTAYLLRG